MSKFVKTKRILNYFVWVGNLNYIKFLVKTLVKIFKRKKIIIKIIKNNKKCV